MVIHYTLKDKALTLSLSFTIHTHTHTPVMTELPCKVLACPLARYRTSGWCLAHRHWHTRQWHVKSRIQPPTLWLEDNLLYLRTLRICFNGQGVTWRYYCQQATLSSCATPVCYSTVIPQQIYTADICSYLIQTHYVSLLRKSWPWIQTAFIQNSMWLPLQFNFCRKCVFVLSLHSWSERNWPNGRWNIMAWLFTKNKGVWMKGKRLSQRQETNQSGGNTQQCYPCFLHRDIGITLHGVCGCMCIYFIVILTVGKS